MNWESIFALTVVGLLGGSMVWTGVVVVRESKDGLWMRVKLGLVFGVLAGPFLYMFVDGILEQL